MRIHPINAPLSFPKERKRSSRVRSTAAKNEISLITGFPQMVEFLDEKPALPTPFFVVELVELVAVGRKRHDEEIGEFAAHPPAGFLDCP